MYIFSDNVYRLFLMFAGSKFNIFYRTWLSIIYFSRIGVDDIHYSNIWNESKCLQLVCKNSKWSFKEFYFLMEDLQIFRLFYFLIEERKYDEASITVRSSILVHFTFWKMDSANGGNFIYIMLFWKSIFKERCIKRS